MSNDETIFDNLTARSPSEYVTTVCHEGREIEFTINVGGGKTLEDAIATSFKFWQDRNSWFEQSQGFAHREQFSVINERITNDKICKMPPLSSAQLTEELRAPSTIILYQGGQQDRFELTYYSDKFGEYVINIEIGLEENKFESNVQCLY